MDGSGRERNPQRPPKTKHSVGVEKRLSANSGRRERLRRGEGQEAKRDGRGREAAVS